MDSNSGSYIYIAPFLSAVSPGAATSQRPFFITPSSSPKPFHTGIDGEDNIDNYRLGYQYNFSKRTLLWAEYIGRNADTPLYGDQNAVSIGTKVLF